MRAPILCPLLALLIALLSSPAATGQSSDDVADIVFPKNVRKVTVSGTGEVRHEPDMVAIHVGVVTEADSAAAAVESNNGKMNQFMNVLREQGIAEKDIQTSSFQISPQRQYPDPEARREPPKIVGYEVTNQVQITVRKLPELGKILDAVVQAGANQIHGIQFSMQDESKLTNEALRKAVANARQKAETLAAEAGLAVGVALLIQESSNDSPQPFMARAMRSQAAESVPVSPGTLTIEASVSVTYEIGEEGDDEDGDDDEP